MLVKNVHYRGYTRHLADHKRHLFVPVFAAATADGSTVRILVWAGATPAAR